MITYLIEVSICWLLFYSIYVLLLSKETFFSINRWYLLSTLILGLIIPLFSVEFSSLFYEEPTKSVVYLAEGFSELEYVIEASIEEAKTVDFSWLTLLTLLYVIGVIAAFIRFIYGFRQIYGLYKEGNIIKKGKYNLILTKTPHLPFSFFNYLFWNKNLTLEDKDSGKIITHELAHINQWHSLDVLFLEFLGIALWFSPPIYWYKKSLRTVHEYLADAYVLRNTKKKQYGHLLIRQVQSGMQVALANNFIRSQLKQRINMMTRNKSRRKALTRYLPALPLLLLMVLVFSNKNVRKNFNETTAKASLAFEELSPDVLKALVTTEEERYFDFDAKKVKQQLTMAYKINYVSNFVGMMPSEAELKKMEDSKKIKNLHKEAKKLIREYPENEKDIKILMKEVALEKGYSVRFNGENIIYQSINKEKQAEETELFKLLVVNGAIVGATNSIIPTDEVQKMEELSPKLAMARFGVENGKNGATLIDSDSWTVLESIQGGTILVRKDDADIYDDGNHIIKKTAKLTDTPPVFPGGEKEMLRFIYTNIKYPAEARKKGIYGEMIAQFTVERDGSIGNLKVKNDLGGGLKGEILRVMELVQEMPEKWTPAMKNGEAVRFTYELPFEYHLKDENGDSPSFTKTHEGIHIVIIGYKANKKEVIKKSDAIYKEVDEMPRFPGCETKEGTKEARNECAQMEMLQFIYTNIKYPEAARKAGIEGTVVVKFVVNETGEIITREIVRSIGGGTDEEVLAVVDKMPTWIPGKKDGKMVSVYYHLPVKFKLENQARDNTGINHQKGKMVDGFEDKVILKDGEIFTGEDKEINKNQIPAMHIIRKEDVISDKKTITGESIYRVVQKMPLFPGCDKIDEYSETLRNCANQKMLEFIYQNIKYPKAARKAGIEGVAVVGFLVEKDGTISDAEILRNPGEGTGEEALRVVNLMAEQHIKWIPGRQDGKAVNVNFNLPVKFKLADDAKEAIAETEAIEKANEKSKDLLKRGLPEENVRLQLGNETLILNAFPNPAKEKLTITLEGAAKDILLTVFDITGKEYFSHKIQTFNGTYYKTITLDNAPKGTLIVNIRHKGKDYQKKVIVQ